MIKMFFLFFGMTKFEFKFLTCFHTRQICLFQSEEGGIVKNAITPACMHASIHDFIYVLLPSSSKRA
jgi:hypothetical protein